MGFVRMNGDGTVIGFNNILATEDVRFLKIRMRSATAAEGTLKILSCGSFRSDIS